MRIVQVGDVAGVADALARALTPYADVVNLPMPQAGARWPGFLKPFAVPLRLMAAARVARAVRRLRPDVVHIHWAPNGIVGVLARRPYVLHAHGDDVRALNPWRRLAFRWLIDRAALIVYSTPDLARYVDGEWLPNPVWPVEPQPGARDVMLSSRADPSKGREVAFQAIRDLPRQVTVDVLDARDAPADIRIRAVSTMSHDEFLRTLASYRIVWGQFKIGHLTLTDLEAMSAGCAVVVWFDPDLSGFYGGIVPVVSSRDPAVIASETLRLLADPGACRALGSAARDFVSRWHDPDVVARRLLALYDSSLSVRR